MTDTCGHLSLSCKTGQKGSRGPRAAHSAIAVIAGVSEGAVVAAEGLRVAFRERVVATLDHPPVFLALYDGEIDGIEVVRAGRVVEICIHVVAHVLPQVSGHVRVAPP